jgi:hypothetical protein
MRDGLFIQNSHTFILPPSAFLLALAPSSFPKSLDSLRLRGIESRSLSAENSLKGALLERGAGLFGNLVQNSSSALMPAACCQQGLPAGLYIA